MVAVAEDDSGSKKEEKPKEEEAWMTIAMDEEWVLEYLEETICGNFNDLDMNLGDEEMLLGSKGETRHTIYSPDHVLDLPNLFDGVDETLDAFDQHQSTIELCT